MPKPTLLFQGRCNIHASRHSRQSKSEDVLDNAVTTLRQTPYLLMASCVQHANSFTRHSAQEDHSSLPRTWDTLKRLNLRLGNWDSHVLDAFLIPMTR
jgi:hypothetical protein